MQADYMEHHKKVERLQLQISQAFRGGEKVKVFHGATNSTRAQNNNGTKHLNISSLNAVIAINIEEQYALVEPNVAMDAFIDATLPYGMMAPIITEFPGITIGGAIMGGAGESSSFKYGCVSELCLEYEVILGNGRKVIASPTKRQDLFNGIASSYGTLGIVTLIKIKLMPSKPYVHLVYHPVTSFSGAAQLMRQHAKGENVDFIDGIMFSKTHGVVMVGYLSLATTLPSATFHKITDEWFYLHAQHVAKNSKYEESIPLKDYLFRYDRGAFWTGKFGFSVHHVPFNRFFRMLFARLFKTRNLLRFLHGSNLAQQFVVQDFCMPQKNAVVLMNFIDKHFAIYPLWVCPLKPNAREFLSPTYNKTDLIINIGVYGKAHVGYDEFVAMNRQLETKVQALHGRKVLYAYAYYLPDHFWSVYDKVHYDSLRKKYTANTIFLNLFDKVCPPKVVTKPSLSKGWLKLIAGERNATP
jgi:delta24-sterol reductase